MLNSERIPLYGPVRCVALYFLAKKSLFCVTQVIFVGNHNNQFVDASVRAESNFVCKATLLHAGFTTRRVFAVSLVVVVLLCRCLSR